MTNSPCPEPVGYDERRGFQAELIPAWFLPPSHPAFRLRPACRGPYPGPSPERYDLWSPGHESGPAPGYFEALYASRAERSWWLRYLPGARERLQTRLPGTRPLLAGLRRVVAQQYGPASRILSVVLTGSYLWSESLPASIDAAVIIDTPLPVLDHWPENVLHPGEQPVVQGACVGALDLLVVGLGALQNPARLRGSLGPWLLEDGQVFPYDLRRRTVFAATCLTLSAGIPVLGPDYYRHVAPSPRDLCNLAYYFVQEASALLALRQEPVKAVQRLLESNLILQFCEERLGRGSEPWTGHLVSRCREAIAVLKARPNDPEMLCTVQGWWGKEPPGLLDLTLRRLVRTVSAMAPLPSPSLRTLARRARRLKHPGWKLLLGRLQRFPGRAILARTVHSLAADPSYEYDRLLIDTQDPEPVTIDAADLLSQALSLYERPPGPLVGTSLLEQATANEREINLCGLVRALLGGVPARFWLGDPSAAAEPPIQEGEHHDADIPGPPTRPAL